MSSTDSRKPHPIEKAEYERISRFRYRLRRFLCVSEKLCKDEGLTPLQYQMLLHVKGFPDRDWASIDELAERNSGRNNRRVAEVHLRPKGEEMLARIAPGTRMNCKCCSGNVCYICNNS